MGNFIKTQNSFANGEVAPEFFARDDINGLSRLENMDVLAGGGLRRRRGLAHVGRLDAYARLIPFSVGEDENYLLVLEDKHIGIYHNGVRRFDLLTPWGADCLSRLQYAQRFDTIIFVHPDYQPHVLAKSGNLFKLEKWGFSSNDDMTLNIPFMKFDDAANIKITVSTHPNGNNYAVFTTSSDFWTPENVQGRVMVLGKQWRIFEYVSPTVVVALGNGGYTLPNGPVSDWREAAFGSRRGWPCSISFHQDRLVFGGSRSWPSGVWMSKVGQHHNFDVGTGLDDEAIFLTLLSEQRQQICTVVSSDNLQILTTVGEWAISNKPLTPSAVDIKQHTAVGTVATRHLPPQTIEGCTVFISGGQKDIRELTLDQLGESYNANDLCALSKHLMQGPVDLAYNEDTHQLFVVMENGDMAVLNKNAAVGISAWAVYKTQGKFCSVAVLQGQTYVVVQRGEKYSIEVFSDDAQSDAGTYGFSYAAAGLPMLANRHGPRKIRIRKIGARVFETKSVFINGRRAPLPNEIYDAQSIGYSGDVAINFLGVTSDAISPPWIIHGSEQLPATILSVTMHGWYLI